MLERSWLGRRVSVRRVVDRDGAGRVQFGDVVGDLIAVDPRTAVVETRSGNVDVPVELIAAAKLVPPSSADELAVEEIVGRSWRAQHAEWLGGWLLRASDGFTGRANSVLPLRTPRRRLDDALAEVTRWYAAHRLPARFQIPVESRRLLDAELAERGWPASTDVHVMTGRLDIFSAQGDGDGAVRLDDVPDDAWLRRYRDGHGATPAARGILTRHDQVVFASVREPDSGVVAIGRGVVDDEWLGVNAVEVAPANRRAGLARTVMQALWDWGRDRGARRTHLEVSADNLAALALYEGLGYRTHHLYRYRSQPGPGSDT